MNIVYPNGIRRVDRQQMSSEVDYVQDGVLYKHVNSPNVLVGSSSDLELLEGYAPGTYAHTAGWVNAWELAVDGTTWVPLGGE